VKVLRVKNWDELQHYGNRNPSWIKLYLRLLDDYDFAQLSDAEVGQLVKVWLLAARSKGEVPYDIKWIASRIACSGKVRLDRFIQMGLLIEADSRESASNLLATPHDRAILERKRKKEKEREREEEDAADSNNDPKFDAWRLRVPATHRDAIHAALRAAQNPDALRREFLGLEHPITGGPSFGPEVVGQAVHEMAVAGTKMSAKTLRAFCRRVGEPERPNAKSEYDQWSPEALAKIGEAA